MPSTALRRTAANGKAARSLAAREASGQPWTGEPANPEPASLAAPKGPGGARALYLILFLGGDLTKSTQRLRTPRVREMKRTHPRMQRVNGKARIRTNVCAT